MSTGFRLIHVLRKLVSNPLKTDFGVLSNCVADQGFGRTAERSAHFLETLTLPHGDRPNSIRFYPDKPILLINRSVIPWILTSLFDYSSLLEFDPCEPHFSLQLYLDCRFLIASSIGGDGSGSSRGGTSCSRPGIRTKSQRGDLC
jgi:hypothetical protein